jgi:RNA polymerase sigma factor (sigma-70 family)
VLAAQDGDEDAFRTVYRAVQPRLLGYIRTLVGEPDAEDVASESWLQIARDLDRFSGDADRFRGWAARIARNRALDHLRMRGRRPAVGGDETELSEKPAESDTADEAMEALATGRTMSLIAQLPQDQAEAVVLRVVVGLDAKSAAQTLGKRVDPRVVFGWPALIEKILAKQAGIDDRTLEVAKIAVMQNSDEAPVPGQQEFRMVGDEDGSLVFAWVRALDRHVGAAMLVPAVVMVAVINIVGLDEQPVPYARYAIVLQLILVLVLIFWPGLVTSFIAPPSTTDLNTIEITLPPDQNLDLAAPPKFD